ncbi:branched-chain amino acid ABC transporter permease [Chloroflexota bacterium]
MLERILEALISGITQGCIFALIALGLVIVFRVTKLWNVLIGEFAMLGSMIGATLYATGLPMFAVIIVPIIAVAILGAAVWQVVFRRPFAKTGATFDLVQVAVALILVSMGTAYLIWGTFVKDFPSFIDFELNVAGISIHPQTPWIWGVLVLGVAGLSYLFERTSLGRALRASAQQPTAARLMGINIHTMAFYSFILSAAIGALAGVVLAPLMMAHYQRGLYLLVGGLLAFLAGGPTKVEGAIGGGLFMGLIESFTGAFISSTYMTVIAVGSFIVVLAIRPQGILGIREEER